MWPLCVLLLSDKGSLPPPPHLRHPKGGSFVRPKKASFGVDYLTAIRRRYEMEVQQVLGEEIQISTRTVEMVGFEAISVKQNNKALEPESERTF